MSTQSAKPAVRPVTAPDIQARKGGDKIVCMTAYDYPTGLAADAAGMDLVLVGDSLAMVVLGHEDTLSVTMDEMIHHAKAASRGVERALLVGDMPFMSARTVDVAMENAGRFVSEGRVKAVKIEGGVSMAPQIRAVVQAGVPVMGHVGLTPQHVARFGGFKAQGKTAKAAQALLGDALAVEEAGAFSVVLEAMPVEVAERITDALTIPTIGIGAGAVTDGQILVYNDVLGVFDRFTPKFVRRFAELGAASRTALEEYVDAVRAGRFPGEEHSFFMPKDQLDELERLWEERD